MLLLGMVCALLSGCRGGGSYVKPAGSETGAADSLAGLTLTRTEAAEWQGRVLDANGNGRMILLQGDGGYQVELVNEQGETAREISISCPEGVALGAVETMNGELYLAGSDGHAVRVYSLDKQGNLTQTVICDRGQTVFDLAFDSQGGCYLLVGDLVENPLFGSSYRENTQVIFMGTDGEITALAADTDTERMFALAETEDGAVWMLTNQVTTEETWVCVYALARGTAEQKDSFLMAQARLLSGMGGGWYLSTDSDLYAYDPAAQTLTYLAKWVNWGVNGAAVRGGSFLSAEHVLLWGDQMTWRLSPRAERGDTVTLRVGVLEPFELPVEEILNFQSAYPEYQVETVSFQDQNALNLAIVSGETLDILQIDELDPTRYEENGLFLELSDRLAGDSDLGSGEFYTALWDMTRRDGALYTLMTGFTIQGLYGPQGAYGEEGSLRLAEFQQALESTRFYETTVRENAVTWLCSVAGFDREGALSQEGQENLAQLLALCGGFAADYDQVDFEIPGAELLFQWLNLSSLPAVEALINQGEALWQTKEVDVWGYPTGAGLAFTCDRSYGILAASEHQEGAWELLRYLLRSGNEDSGIPVRRPTGIPLLDRLVSQVRCEALGYASPILGIIQEEAAPCFAGDKTPEAAAEVIANRVRVYVGEQQ